MDDNGDEVICLEEFLSAMKLRLNSRIAQFEKLETEVKRREATALMDLRLTRQFRRVDLNKDEHLTQSEVEDWKSGPVVR